MSGSTIADFIRARLAEAKDQNITMPAILTLSRRSEHSRYIFEDLHGHPLSPLSSDVGHEFGPWEVMEPAEAARLLRDHAGKGGALAADVITDPFWSEAMPLDFWFVGLLKENIYIRGFLDGEEVWHTVTGYDSVPRGHRTPSELAHEGGPSLWRVSTDGGAIVPVCGRGGKDVILAAALAGIVADRVIDIRHEGKPVQIAVNDDRLASLLLDVYGDKPHVIAEALMALKKSGENKHLWLQQVLGSRPELKELAKAVHHELTGQ